MAKGRYSTLVVYPPARFHPPTQYPVASCQ